MHLQTIYTGGAGNWINLFRVIDFVGFTLIIWTLQNNQSSLHTSKNIQRRWSTNAFGRSFELKWCIQWTKVVFVVIHSSYVYLLRGLLKHDKWHVFDKSFWWSKMTKYLTWFCIWKSLWVWMSSLYGLFALSKWWITQHLLWIRALVNSSFYKFNMR